MGKCDICGRNEKDLTLIGVTHKELGFVNVCQACWKKLYEDNLFVGGSSSSDGPCCG
ncbi:MAG: hypothetical protein ACE5OY_00990 [Candidatus Bathyarchaeia archaeon]